MATPPLRLGTPAGRYVLVTAILGTSVAFLDGTVVTVALPVLGRDLGASVAGLQWTINAYTLTLAALLLTGGVLGDRYGRRYVFVLGAVGFGAASLLCAVSVSIEMLIAARAIQGVAAALLTPTSLALLQSLFHPDDRARAIGAWSGLTGVATAVGPFVGGWLVDIGSWRWVFAINVPFIAIVVALALRAVPETKDPDAARSIDVSGIVLLALGLGSLTYALIAAGDPGPVPAGIMATGLVGFVLLVAFVMVEGRRTEPMVPLGLFRSLQFSAANVVTFLVYGGLSVVFLLVVLELQIGSGYSAVGAGMSLIPVTVLLLLLSSRAGDLARRIGPRIPMTFGPLGAGVGVWMLSGVEQNASYVADVLPGATVFGLGLALTVAPLTATVLAAAPDRYAGLASGINNGVARTAGLLTIAVIPPLAGLSGDAYLDPELMTASYGTAMLIAAALMVAGGVGAWFTIRKPAELEHVPMACPVNAPQLSEEHHGS